MPPDYEEDDFVDYANEASDYYDEEDIVADIAEIRIMLEGTNNSKSLSDNDIRTALEKHDYDLDKTAKNLKNQLSKASKKALSTTTAPKSKYMGLNEHVENDASKPTGEKTTRFSKIAALADTRAAVQKQKNASNTTEKRPGRSLDLLRRTLPIDSSDYQRNEIEQTGDTRSGLKKLAARNVTISTENKAKHSKLLENLNRPRFPKPDPVKPDEPKKLAKSFPSVNYASIHSVRSLSRSKLGSVFDMHHRIFRSITNTIYSADQAAKVKTAFSKPSPDDVILAAQKEAFLKSNEGEIDSQKNLRGEKTKSPIKSSEKKTETLTRKLENTSLSSSSVSVLTKNVRKLDLSKEEMKKKDTKPRISFVVIGHVDAGKSTLMGRLLYDCGAVSEHVINKYKKESASSGKASFAFAWAFDQREDERQLGVTIDICVSSFDTDKAHFTVIDAPGHRDFVPNMIAGSAQTNNAVLVVDSSTDAFEAGFRLDGQTKEHAVLVRSLGVENVIVAVNKLDTSQWSQTRFDQIQNELSDYLITKVGFSKKDLSFVPTSGLNGENVVKKPKESKLTAWYKGPTLLEQLEKNQGSKADLTENFRLVISNVYTADHAGGAVAAGKIDTGGVQVGETIIVSPSCKVSKVKSIKEDGIDSEQQYAIAGQNVILVLSDLVADDMRAGDVICNLEAQVQSVSTFRSRVIIFDIQRPILQGSKMLLHRGRSNFPCRISKIFASIDKSNGQVIKRKPRHLTSGQAAQVEITLDDHQTIPLERFKDNKSLGRFVLRYMGVTVAAGVVDDLEENTKQE